MAQHENKDTSGKGRIDELKEKLYSRGGPPSRAEHHVLSKTEYEVENAWEKKHRTEQAMSKPKNTKFSLINILLLISLIALAGAVLYALIALRNGFNVVSPDNILINVTGPVAVEAGEKFTLNVDIENKNSVRLDTARLLVTLPDSVHSALISPDDDVQEVSFDLGQINAGETLTERLNLVIFDEEGAKPEISFEVEYKAESSNAIFSTDKTYAVEVSSAPVSLAVEAPDALTSGQNVEYQLTVASNTDDILDNLVLRAEYSPGFTFINASPKTEYDNNVWHIDQLRPQQRLEYTIRGVIVGQDDEKRVVHFALGTEDPRDDKQISSTLLSKSHTTVVTRPFINAHLLLNGNDGEEFVARSGQEIQAELVWENNLSRRVRDIEIEANLGGLLFRDLEVEDGVYRQINDVLTWSPEDNTELRSVDAGASGSFDIEFTVASTSDMVQRSISPNQTNEIVITAEEDGSGQASQIFSTSQIEFLVATDVDVNARATYTTGPFDNTGPLPPVADEETTYTMIWSVSNALSDARNAYVQTTLPSYVRWKDSVSPSTEHVQYNPVTGETRWNLGTLTAGTGYDTPARSVSFQIGLVPANNQVGTIVSLATGAVFAGEDVIVERDIRETLPNITTLIEFDPAFEEEWAIISAN